MRLSNMHFFYDAQGKPCQVNRGGTIYNYVLNLQGDVVGLTDASGNLVVEYKYDAWGKLLGISGSLATSLGTVNPLRYRGYVYDNETGLYYLHSRYYDPEMRRFVSVDVYIGDANIGAGYNLYLYCANNCVNNIDPHGKLFERIIKFINNKFIVNKLNDTEIALCAKYPFAALEVKWAKETACIVTKELFGENWNSDDTMENAFKHCLWNALMAYRIGVEKARMFGEAHENGMMENYPQSTTMDLHNNEVGYAIVQLPIDPSEYSKAALASYAAKYGNAH